MGNYKPRYKKGSRPTNKYRAKMRAYAISEGICTQCFSKPVEKDRVQCLRCINMARKKRGAEPIKSKDKSKQRAKAREYRHKALVNKVRKLDRIRYAVEKGGEL